MPNWRGPLTIEMFEERTLPSNFASSFHDQHERQEQPEPHGLGAIIVSFRPFTNSFRSDDSQPSTEKRDASPVIVGKWESLREIDSAVKLKIEKIENAEIEKSGAVNIVAAPTLEPASTLPVSMTRAAASVSRAPAELAFFAPPASEHAAIPATPTTAANAPIDRTVTTPDVQVASNLAALALYALCESETDAPTLSPDIAPTIPESIPQSETAPAPYEILPIAVDVPQSPIIGALALEVAAIGDGITRVLDRAAEIIVEELDEPYGFAWYTAGMMLGAWMGYSLWTNRTTRRQAALEVWHDARTG